MNLSQCCSSNLMSGGIQIALTVFVLSFPVLIAVSFFSILWYKPYVFYSPSEFGVQTKVSEYVEAITIISKMRPSDNSDNSSFRIVKINSCQKKDSHHV